MDYNNKTIVLSELIGLKCRVVTSLDRNQKGIAGKVVDETKNTIILETRSGQRTVAKSTSIFKFYSGSSSFTVNGKEINFRPHERIEKAMKFYRARKV